MKTNNKNLASVFYLFSNLFNKGIAFLTIPIYTRMLSTGDYGITNIYTSWIDIITVFFSLALYISIRTAFVDFSNDKFSFLNTIVTFTIFWGSFLGITIVLFGTFFFDIKTYLLILAAIHGISNAIIMDYQQYLMMEIKFIKRSIYLAIPNFLSALISIILLIFLPFEEKYLCRIIPLAIVHFGFQLVILFKIYFKQKPKINTKYIKYGLDISLPLVLHGIALNILSQSDRTMIKIYDNVSGVGIYSLVYNFGMIAMVMTTALDGIWIPWFMTKLKDKNIEEINNKSKKYINFISIIMIELMLVCPDFLKILASKEYWEGIIIIPPIVIANYFIFIYSLYVNVEHLYKKTKMVTVNTMISAICNIVLNVIFIPKYGYFAAAFTTAISYFFSMCLHMAYTYTLEKSIFPIKNIIRPLLIILLFVFIYYLLMNSIVLRYTIVIIIALGYILLNYKNLKLILKKED